MKCHGAVWRHAHTLPCLITWECDESKKLKAQGSFSLKAEATVKLKHVPRSQDRERTVHNSEEEGGQDEVPTVVEGEAEGKLHVLGHGQL